MKAQSYWLWGSLLALVLQGCVASVNPLYGPGDVELDAAIAGDWSPVGGTLATPTLLIRKKEDGAYLVRKEGEAGTGHLLRLGAHYFLDVEVQRKEHQYHFFYKIALAGGELIVTPVDGTWVLIYLAEHPSEQKEFDAMAQPGDKFDHRLFIAPTPKLRRFIARMADTSSDSFERYTRGAPVEVAAAGIGGRKQRTYEYWLMLRALIEGGNVDGSDPLSPLYATENVTEPLAPKDAAAELALSIEKLAERISDLPAGGVDPDAVESGLEVIRLSRVAAARIRGDASKAPPPEGAMFHRSCAPGILFASLSPEGVVKLEQAKQRLEHQYEISLPSLGIDGKKELGK